MTDRHKQDMIPYRPVEGVRERLQKASLDYNLPINWLINKAVTEFLDNLIPPDEIKWTR